MSLARCECDATVDTDYNVEGMYCRKCYAYICPGCVEVMIEDGLLALEVWENGETETICKKCQIKEAKVTT